MPGCLDEEIIQIYWVERFQSLFCMDVDNSVFVRIEETQVFMPPRDETSGTIEESGLGCFTIINAANPFPPSSTKAQA